MNPLMNASQVSSYLGISRRSFETLIARGDGPRFLWVGSQRRWVPEELIDWTSKRTGRPSRKEVQVTHR